MIEAKDFWEYLCVDLDYRLFAGVPCIGLKCLYDKMDPRIMHYIPAAEENIALGLVSGAFLAGMKGGILIDIKNLHNILNSLCNFNLKYNIPFLVIAYAEDVKFNKILSMYKIPCRNLSNNFKRDLKYITNKSEKFYIPGLITIGKGVLI